MEGYDVALVCLNGHAINDSAGRSPEFNKKFCKQCGAAAMRDCPSCRSPIQGRYHVAGFLDLEQWRPHAYCHECGTPFPWTESRLRAAAELIDLSDATPADKETLKRDLPALVGDTPQAQVAGARMKKFMLGAGKQVADGLKQVLVEVLAEAAKRQMGL